MCAYSPKAPVRSNLSALPPTPGVAYVVNTHQSNWIIKPPMSSSEGALPNIGGNQGKLPGEPKIFLQSWLQLLTQISFPDQPDPQKNLS